jgi:uncharacterized protein YdeI (YjbR/CyaY-like superfamily)
LTETYRDLPVLGFPDQAAFEAWLAAQPRDHPGLWLKLAKKGSGVPSLSASEMVDACLAHGWIDGLLNRWDEQAYVIRCTPRKRRSKWSEINVARAETLIAAGRMAPAGQAEVDAARADGRWAAAYPPASRMQVPDDLRSALDADAAVATAFDALDGANRYAILYRLHGARRPEVRARKIAGLVAMLREGRRIHD